MNELQRSPESRATPRSATRNASHAAWQQSKPNAKWGTSESLICLTLTTHDGTPPSCVSSKRQQGSRRPVDAVEPPPEQIFRASNRYAVGNDHRDSGNRKIRRNRRNAKKPAAVLVLVSRRVCGWRIVVIGVIGRMMVARHCLDFIQAVSTRRVDGESNGNSRRHQREQVKCGDYEACFPVPVFSCDR